MQFSTIILASLAAFASAAPAFREDEICNELLHPRAFGGISCDPSRLSPPAAPTPLPAAASGSKVVLVAIGKGTQNFTCADGSASTTPVAQGALANLYNASCLASASQTYLNMVTYGAYRVPARDVSGLPTVGQHYFVDSTTPTFQLDNIGITELKKGAASAAPTNSNNDTTWLFLNSQAQGTNTKITNVYRVETQGGLPPANCAGKAPGVFTVPYAAQYWFYSD